MNDLLIFAIFFALLAFICVYRLVKGPTAADRMVAGDNVDILLCCAMILFSLFSGRGVYLDIALICGAVRHHRYHCRRQISRQEREVSQC